MYTYSYGIDIVRTVKLTVETLGYDIEDYTWKPAYYYIALIPVVFITMPAFLLIVLTQDKWDIVKAAAYAVLERNFDFEKEK